MNKKPLLKIKTLNRLHITNDTISFPLERKRSAQVELLLIYLIIKRHDNVTNQQLIKLLWQDGSLDKPDGALRNLVYRARKEMKKFFADEECIKSKGKSYCWNLKVDCRIDYEEVLKLCQKVNKIDESSHKYEKCLNLLEKYDGNFLPEFSDNDWIILINQYLKNQCLEAVLKTLNKLMDNGCYEEVIQICNHKNCQKFSDTRIYEAKLYAYYKTGKKDQALSFYHMVVDYYYSKYGIEVSTKLKEIYQKILTTSIMKQVTVNELEESLIDHTSINKTYYCDYDVFKNIYQINLRCAKRSKTPRVLALLTVSIRVDDVHALESEAMILKKVIANSLRKNDVYTKINANQYALILDTPDFPSATVAIERILTRFGERKKYTQAEIRYDLKIIA